MTDFVDYPPIMNVKTLSEYLGVGRDIIYTLAARNEIPHFHVGRHLRFHRDDIDAWARSHEHRRFASLKPVRKAR